MTRSLTVLKCFNATITDLGRVAGPANGLPVNGALDQYSAQIANVLVANADDAPIVEVVLSDLEFIAEARLFVAVTGAPLTVRVDDAVQPMWKPFVVEPGQRLSASNMQAGLRSYIAVHGGFAAPRLFGSCAPDTVVGFGHSISPGTVLSNDSLSDGPSTTTSDLSLFDFGVLVPYFSGDVVVDVVDGPDISQFAATAERLFRRPFEVLPQSNHVGLRLTGDLPVRSESSEMISRGVPVGAVEVPPGDELVVLHRGRGVTAGYPVLGVVAPVSLDVLGQVRPGQKVQFRRTTVDEAQRNAHNWYAAVQDVRGRTQRIYSMLQTAA